MARPKTPTKRKKRARKKKTVEQERVSSPGLSTVKESVRAGGGGVMQGLRNGFKRAAGAGDENEEKPSTLSNVLWTILLLAAIGLLLYRWLG
ncbi:MAG: hypothetical protein KF729_35985 [Sandaracinaceae bacterium]|nr:hypothetical protein [Sandaracinaceae bacterium]